ncbi:MAG TPA: hypothetical protein VFC63_23750 [Blastocatellia bacterium]|nr:hypothetical protein [Blastocatellia bacterium]
MKPKTKNQFAIDLLGKERGKRLTGRTVTFINSELVKRFGPGGRLPGAEIGKLAEEIGLEVDLIDLAGFDDDQRYEAAFEHLLKFDSLASAKNSIEQIDALFRKYKAANDVIGMNKAKEVALRGKKWASVVSKNKRVNPAKRAEKAEIAEWFSVWLRTPDLFQTWSELRQTQLIKENPDWFLSPDNTEDPAGTS